MLYVCDAGAATWFRLETAAEAALESRIMNHAVEKYYLDMHEKAAQTYEPPKGVPVAEQNIGLKGHVQRGMPIFLTLRDGEGASLVTAMLPPAGFTEKSFRPIVVGPANADPYQLHSDAVAVLAKHYGLTLDPIRCYPYRRG